MLRRTLFEVPSLAIVEVYWHVNESEKSDQVLAHKLSTVPLTADRETLRRLVRADECCQVPTGCPRCAVRLRFVAADRNATTANLTCDRNAPVYVSPIRNDLAIVSLRCGQRVIADCLARKGNALDHARWRAVAIVSSVEIDGDDGAGEMTVTTCGAQSAPELVLAAVDIIEERLDALRRQISDRHSSFAVPGSAE
jgi:DNA-directed RNA polymerase alpha subunit